VDSKNSLKLLNGTGSDLAGVLITSLIIAALFYL
jgi:hypothetical protein